MSKPAIYSIRWKDHSSPSGAWLTAQEVKAQIAHIPMINSVGYLVAEDKHCYSLAALVSDEGVCGLVINILKSTIVSKKRLK